MSRTYRRQKGYNRNLAWHVGDWVKLEGFTTRWLRPLPKDSVEYRKGLAVYHSDKTSSFKEPGPSWFRNMFSERPMRRRNKRELLKFMRVPDYEPMVFDKYPLEYWT